jgi:hypothetical protein
MDLPGCAQQKEEAILFFWPYTGTLGRSPAWEDTSSPVDRHSP